jgi:hydrogenase-4 component F
VLALALVVAFGALLLRTQQMLFGEPSMPSHAVDASRLPWVLHLSLVLIMGLYIPDALVLWFQRAAELLG